MFPIYLKRDEKDPPPEEPFAFIVGRDGIYIQKRHLVFTAVVPAKEVESLAEVKCEAQYLLPPIPAELVMRMLLFFRAVWEREHSEALLFISYNQKRGTFRLDAPDQQVDATRCTSNDEFRAVEGFTFVGTCHSHGSLTAFHSDKDESDEMNFDGIHITFGRIADKRIDIVASLAVSGKRFPQDVERVLAGTHFVKSTSHTETPTSAPAPLAANDTLVVADPPEVSPAQSLSEAVSTSRETEIHGEDDEGDDVILTDAGEVITGESHGLHAIIQRYAKGPFAELVAWRREQDEKSGKKKKRARRRAHRDAQKQAQQAAGHERRIGFVASPGPVTLSGYAGGTNYPRYIYEPEGFVVELPPDVDPEDATPPLEWSAQVHKIEHAVTTTSYQGSYHGGVSYYTEGDGVPYVSQGHKPPCKRCSPDVHTDVLHRVRDRVAVGDLFEYGDVCTETKLLDTWWDSAKSTRDALSQGIEMYFNETGVTPPTVFIDKLRAFFKAKRSELKDPITNIISPEVRAGLGQKYVPEPEPIVAPVAEVPSKEKKGETHVHDDFNHVEDIVVNFRGTSDNALQKMILALPEIELNALWAGLIPILGGESREAAIKWKNMTLGMRLSAVRAYLEKNRDEFYEMMDAGKRMTFVRDPLVPKKFVTKPDNGTSTTGEAANELDTPPPVAVRNSEKVET